MSHVMLAKSAEIDRNLGRFLELLPDLMREHEGEYASLRDTAILGFYDSAINAQIAGNQRFSDHIFSIQQVKDTAEELGYLAYALHTRKP